MNKQALGPKLKAPLSPAIRAGNLVFISGQVPLGVGTTGVPDGIEAQTRLVIESIRGILAEVGADLGSVVKTTVFLTDMTDFPAMNRVYGTYFAEEPPARSTIQVKLAVDVRVEIEAIAVVG